HYPATGRAVDPGAVVFVLAFVRGTLVRGEKLYVGG
ncbi:MAG: hypothetical protein ACI8Z5_001876, partial [Lentimonas sp.]